MNEVWGEEVLKIPSCRVLYGDKRQMLFQGPRVKMGLYEGVPTRVCPHTTSGRADYFGPLVNRYQLPPHHAMLQYLCLLHARL